MEGAGEIDRFVDFLPTKILNFKLFGKEPLRLTGLLAVCPKP